MINPNLNKDSVLYNIVSDKQAEIEKRKNDFPLSEFVNSIKPCSGKFYTRLQDSAKPFFILECKKASPSKGLIREDFDVAQIVKTYDKYATVISVLTDEKYFQGSFDYIKTAKQNTSAPVLCKDFFIDEYQIYLARNYGANAILLMLSVLDDEMYKQLSATADKLGLGILTEVSNKDECTRAKNLGAKVIGINNRNLRDLSTDLNRTAELKKHLPDDIIIVSESGIYTFNDTIKLRPNADGFLIGSSIMAQPNIDIAIRKIVYGENKICGLQTPNDAIASYNAGAVYGGLIFVEKSKRYVDIQTAQSIINSANLNYIGVFQNHPADEVVKIANALNLYGVQLHGDETQDYINKIKSALPNTKIFKAIGVDETAEKFPEYPTADYYILDTIANGQSGGTGKTFNWNIIPNEIKSKSLLSGGIGIDNIPTAIKQNTLGLDMNSKLENDNNEKQHDLIEQAFKIIKTKA